VKFRRDSPHCRLPTPGRRDRFLTDLKDRLSRSRSNFNPDKTRLIAFGRFVAERRRARGEGKPETFDFLGSRIFVARRG